MKKKLVLALTVGFLFVFVFPGCFRLKPPTTFVKTFDEPGTWKTIIVRPGLSGSKVWELMIDTLARKFDLEVIEKDSGYLRTSWKYTYVRRGTVVDRYRARIVVKTKGENWEKLQIKCEANWLGDGGWILGYDLRLLEDTYGDLQGKLGTVRR